MPPVPRRDPNLAERKIYFHKVMNDADPDFVLDRAEVGRMIAALRDTPEFYVDEGDEQYLSALVDRSSPPQRVRFYRIRRRNLPETERGGTFEDLRLAEQQGLAESIHIVLFEDSVIGSEYNHYGPRVTTFGSFLNERCDQDVRIRPFIRSDVIGSILAMREIRRFRLKLTPHGVAQLQQSGISLGESFGVTDVYQDGKYFDLTLATEPYDEGFTERIKGFVRRLRDAAIDPSTAVEAAQAYGVTSDDLLDELDLLHDRVVIVEQIRRETPRHRTLDTEAAYATVESVYEQLRDDLAEGGTLTVEQP